MSVEELKSKYKDIDFGDKTIDDFLRADKTKSKLYTPKIIEFYQEGNDYDEVTDLVEEYRNLSIKRLIQRDINIYETYKDFHKAVYDVRNEDMDMYTEVYDEDTNVEYDDEDIFVVQIRKFEELVFYSKLTLYKGSYDELRSTWIDKSIIGGDLFYYVYSKLEEIDSEYKVRLVVSYDGHYNRVSDKFLVIKKGSIDYYSDINGDSYLKRLNLNNNIFLRKYDEYGDGENPLDDSEYTIENILQNAGYSENEWYYEDEDKNIISFKSDYNTIDVAQYCEHNEYAGSLYIREIPFDVKKVVGSFWFYDLDKNTGIEIQPYETDVPNEVTNNVSYDIQDGCGYSVPRKVGGNIDLTFKLENNDSEEFEYVDSSFPVTCKNYSLEIDGCPKLEKGQKIELDFSGVEKVSGDFKIQLETYYGERDFILKDFDIKGTENIEDRILGDIILQGVELPKMELSDGVYTGHDGLISFDKDVELDFSKNLGDSIGYVGGNVSAKNLTEISELPRYIQGDLIITDSTPKDFENMPYVHGEVKIDGYTQEEYDKVKPELYHKYKKYDTKHIEHQKTQPQMFEGFKYIKPFEL